MTEPSAAVPDASCTSDVDVASNSRNRLIRVVAGVAVVESGGGDVDLRLVN